MGLRSLSARSSAPTTRGGTRRRGGEPSGYESLVIGIPYFTFIPGRARGRADNPRPSPPSRVIDGATWSTACSDLSVYAADEIGGRLTLHILASATGRRIRAPGRSRGVEGLLRSSGEHKKLYPYSIPRGGRRRTVSTTPEEGSHDLLSAEGPHPACAEPERLNGEQTSSWRGLSPIARLFECPGNPSLERQSTPRPTPRAQRRPSAGSRADGPSRPRSRAFVRLPGSRSDRSSMGYVQRGGPLYGFSRPAGQRKTVSLSLLRWPPPPALGPLVPGLSARHAAHRSRGRWPPSGAAGAPFGQSAPTSASLWRAFPVQPGSWRHGTPRARLVEGRKRKPAEDRPWIGASSSPHLPLSGAMLVPLLSLNLGLEAGRGGVAPCLWA
jgi:hypothetical protein